MGKLAFDRRNDRKKLSWVYRKKAKLRRKERAENSEANKIDNANENGQNSRIIVRNLSFKVTEKDVRKFYQPFGEITEINLLKRPDGSLVGCGFIRFRHVEDASKAIFNTNKKELLGRTIYSNWAISKSRFCEKLEKGLADDQQTNKNYGYRSSQDTQEEDTQGTHKEHDEHENDEEQGSSKTHQKRIMKEKDIVRKQRRRKILKKMKQKKRAKIVIRNLAFKITEDNLKEHFSQYGEIEEIKILTKPDGKPTGVAFLQFNLVQSAAKAIHHANMKPLLDRAMVVDWAVPKNKFSQNGADVKSEMKTESIDENEHYISEVKIDNDEIESDLDAEADSKEVTMESRKADDESDDEEAEIKDESEDTDNDESKNNGEDEKDDEPDEEEVEIKDESEDTDNDERNNDDEANDDDDDDDDDDDKDNINITINQSIKEEKDEYNRSNTKHPRRISNDVSEGKTVFLKNLPFSVKNDELKEYMKQFGPVDYALVCIDPLTEYSRGTAFVKFQHVQDAEKCLASNELRLRDQIIEVHRALHRNEVLNKKSLKEQRIKDTRNLYLIKEGVVLAGSPAAVSVSVSDMEKRLKLEQWKSQMLRNLNMFVSRVRLAVHNLPPDLDDAKLRQICKNHSGPKAVIKEARVMRDLKNVDATGKGKSKEYGFVAFTTHEDALKALRSLNNNPNIFSKTRRPILGFSIENRILVNAKERRIQKSRDRNPLWSGNNNKRKREDAKEEKVPIKRLKARKSDNSDEKPYAGITGNLGQDRLRSNYNLKSQAQLHMQTVKKQKKVNKMTKELKTLKKEKAKRRQENMPVKQKKKFDEDDANFNKLLNNYRSKLKGINLKKSKWYESTSQS